MAYVQLALGDLRASAATFERTAAAASQDAGLLGPRGLLDSSDMTLETGALAVAGPHGAAGTEGASVQAGRAMEGPDSEVSPDPDLGRVEAGGAAGLEALVQRNRGLQLFAEADYKGALHDSGDHNLGLCF